MRAASVRSLRSLPSSGCDQPLDVFGRLLPAVPSSAMTASGQERAVGSQHISSAHISLTGAYKYPLLNAYLIHQRCDNLLSTFEVFLMLGFCNGSF